MRAIYRMNYLGAVGIGGGVMYVGDGVLAGADFGGGSYRGAYAEASGQMNIEAVMSLPAGTSLVTGASFNQPTDLPLKASWPLDFGNGQALTILVAGRPVQVTFEKVSDLP
jgi:hypothetical protein